MYTLRSIEIFIHVVEANSFSRVAKLLGLSRAAISKQIALLEQGLGTTLLLRSTRAIALTAEGELVYQEYKRILENLEEVKSRLSLFKKEPEGLLSVVSGPVFAHKYIIPYLPVFFQQFPKIQLDLKFRHEMPNMLEDKIDIVIAVHGSGPPDSIQRTVILTRGVFCATPAYLKKAGVPRNLENLRDHLVIIHPISPGITSINVKNGKRFNLTPAIVMNDQLAIKSCGLADMGIIYVQHHVVEGDLKQGELVEVLSDYMEKKNTIPIHMHYLQRRFMNSKIRAFIDFVLKNTNFKN